MMKKAVKGGNRSWVARSYGRPAGIGGVADPVAPSTAPQPVTGLAHFGLHQGWWSGPGSGDRCAGLPVDCLSRLRQVQRGSPGQGRMGQKWACSASSVRSY